MGITGQGTYLYSSRELNRTHGKATATVTILAERQEREEEGLPVLLLFVWFPLDKPSYITINNSRGRVEGERQKLVIFVVPAFIV